MPSNYLPLGTQFDATQYPLLYAELGTDTTPTASSLNLPTLTSGQYAIKATSGLSENAQDNVINTLNEQRSYSTEEHLTGRKWIDGKPTYEKTIDCGSLPNSTTKNVAHNISNLDRIVCYKGNVKVSNGDQLPLPYVSEQEKRFDIQMRFTNTNIVIATQNSFASSTSTFVTLEYTKSTT